jgi:predicted Fe-S protein YdhL (DUF1289 family)
MAEQTIDSKLDTMEKCKVPDLPYIKGKERVMCKGCNRDNKRCCSYFPESEYEKQNSIMAASIFRRNQQDVNQNYQNQTDEGESI